MSTPTGSRAAATTGRRVAGPGAFRGAGHAAQRRAAARRPRPPAPGAGWADDDLVRAARPGPPHRPRRAGRARAVRHLLGLHRCRPSPTGLRPSLRRPAAAREPPRWDGSGCWRPRPSPCSAWWPCSSPSSAASGWPWAGSRAGAGIPAALVSTLLGTWAFVALALLLGGHRARRGRARPGEPRLGGAAGAGRGRRRLAPSSPPASPPAALLPSAALGDSLRAALLDGHALVGAWLVMLLWALAATCPGLAAVPLERLTTWARDVLGPGGRRSGHRGAAYPRDVTSAPPATAPASRSVAT